MMECYGIVKAIIYENYIIRKLHMITMLSKKGNTKDISKDNYYHVKICIRKRLKGNLPKC